ncbi:hypothetical protein EV426DRAFT_204298 [Tirmania nivea]|nr:hypothetical protein EV426DRAFT_204298 [Tirmania nivea]
MSFFCTRPIVCDSLISSDQGTIISYYASIMGASHSKWSVLQRSRGQHTGEGACDGAASGTESRSSLLPAREQIPSQDTSSPHALPPIFFLLLPSFSTLFLLRLFIFTFTSPPRPVSLDRLSFLFPSWFLLSICHQFHYIPF